MTDQQPHTPTTEEVKAAYRYDRTGKAIRLDDCSDPSIINVDHSFDHWLQRIEAAAEQRGAEEGWGLAIDYAWDDSSIYEADAKRAKAANPYRADQKEGFNDSHDVNAT